MDAAEEYRLKSILVYSEQVYSFVQRSKNTWTSSIGLESMSNKLLLELFKDLLC